MSRRRIGIISIMRSSAIARFLGRARAAKNGGVSADRLIGALPLRAYPTRRQEMPLVPAPPRREWMDRTSSGFANRCLPLLIANQWGWFILNDRRVEVLWNGGGQPKDLHIHYDRSGSDECTDPEDLLAVSHFGHGILTWRIPYLFRAASGWNLYVRGPTNWCKDGAAPLDGVVEGDQSSATFTMNWRITRADTWLAFEEREPICMIFPVPRGSVEHFTPEIHRLSTDPVLERAYKTWKQSRDEFNRSLRADGADMPWQKHYFRGLSVLGEFFTDHQTRLAVRKFQDLR